MQRLKKRRDFLAAAKGSKAARSAFVIEARRRDDDGEVRIGYTVTKRTAVKAVERNRMRRRLRSLIRLAAPDLAPGHDYVLVARRRALTENFRDMRNALTSAIAQLRNRGAEALAQRERS